MNKLNRVLLLALVLLAGVAMARFIVPGKSERQIAVGSLAGLPIQMQRTFTDQGEFSAIPEPGLSDWLSSHEEKGQTYKQFLNSRPNIPRGARRKLYIMPLGKFDQSKAPSIELLRQYTAAYYYPMQVVLLPSIELANIRSRNNGGKRQLLTTDVLDALQRRLPADAYSMLGLTMTDLYAGEGWNFVFGQARLRARVGVFSFARYHPSFHGSEVEDQETVKRLILKRAAKVLTHETGHMFGVKHCVHYHCNMNGANHLQEADASPMHLCPVCLRKMHHAIRFDPVARYKKLLLFYKKHELKEEALWMEKRIKQIEQ
ncbi:MAG: archaemetzincin [Akkermansiaceae bacterium]